MAYQFGVRCSCKSGCEPQELVASKEVICICDKNKDCQRCGGTGFWQWKECIYSHITPNVTLFYDAYTGYKSGVMPYSGGSMEQTNSFFKNLKFYENVLHKYREFYKNRRK